MDKREGRHREQAATDIEPLARVFKASKTKPSLPRQACRKSGHSPRPPFCLFPSSPPLQKQRNKMKNSSKMSQCEKRKAPFSAYFSLEGAAACF